MPEYNLSATPLLNRKRVKLYVKERCERHDIAFAGVTDAFYLALEDRLKVVINDAIVKMPKNRKRLSAVPQGFTA